MQRDRLARRIGMRRIIVMLGLLACAGCVGTGDDRHSVFRSRNDQVASERPPARRSWLRRRLGPDWGVKAIVTKGRIPAAPADVTKTAKATPEVELSVERTVDNAGTTAVDPSAHQVKVATEEVILPAGHAP